MDMPLYDYIPMHLDAGSFSSGNSSGGNVAIRNKKIYQDFDDENSINGNERAY